MSSDYGQSEVFFTSQQHSPRDKQNGFGPPRGIGSPRGVGSPHRITPSKGSSAFITSPFGPVKRGSFSTIKAPQPAERTPQRVYKTYGTQSTRNDVDIDVNNSPRYGASTDSHNSPRYDVATDSCNTHNSPRYGRTELINDEYGEGDEEDDEDYEPQDAAYDSDYHTMTRSHDQLNHRSHDVSYDRLSQRSHDLAHDQLEHDQPPDYGHMTQSHDQLNHMSPDQSHDFDQMTRSYDQLHVRSHDRSHDQQRSHDRSHDQYVRSPPPRQVQQRSYNRSHDPRIIQDITNKRTSYQQHNQNVSNNQNLAHPPRRTQHIRPVGSPDSSHSSNPCSPYSRVSSGYIKSLNQTDQSEAPVYISSSFNNLTLEDLENDLNDPVYPQTVAFPPGKSPGKSPGKFPGNSRQDPEIVSRSYSDISRALPDDLTRQTSSVSNLYDYGERQSPRVMSPGDRHLPGHAYLHDYNNQSRSSSLHNARSPNVQNMSPHHHSRSNQGNRSRRAPDIPTSQSTPAFAYDSDSQQTDFSDTESLPYSDSFSFTRQMNGGSSKSPEESERSFSPPPTPVRAKIKIKHIAHVVKPYHDPPIYRQNKLDEALLSSGRLGDALKSLTEWLEKAETYVSEDQPILGDLDTTNLLIEQHKVNIYTIY